MSDTVIHPATPGDAPVIAKLHVASWRETYPGIVPEAYLAQLDVQSRTEFWRGFLDSHAADNRTFIAAGPGSDPVGFAHCGPQPADGLHFAGEIKAIYNLRQAQRRGLGTELMAEMARALAAAGMNSTSLWVARANPATAFYERLGGVVVAQGEEKRGGVVIPNDAYGWETLEGLI